MTSLLQSKSIASTDQPVTKYLALSALLVWIRVNRGTWFRVVDNFVVLDCGGLFGPHKNKAKADGGVETLNLNLSTGSSKCLSHRRRGGAVEERYTRSVIVGLRVIKGSRDAGQYFSLTGCFTEPPTFLFFFRNSYNPSCIFIEDTLKLMEDVLKCEVYNRNQNISSPAEPMTL